jgi:hypothetical protein
VRSAATRAILEPHQAARQAPAPEAIRTPRAAPRLPPRGAVSPAAGGEVGGACPVSVSRERRSCLSRAIWWRRCLALRIAMSCAVAMR